MRKTTKRITALVLAVLLFAGITGSVMAADDIWATTDTQLVYRTTKKGYSNVNINLANSSRDFTIKRTGIKIAKGGTGAKLSWLSKQQTREYVREYLSESSSGSAQWERSKESSKYYYYSAGLMVNHSGTATVKYTVDGEAYTAKVKVLNYKNPVKKITLSGVKGGKNFSSLTKKDMYQKKLSVTSKVSSATLKVTAAKGWKVTNLRITEYDKKGNPIKNRYTSCTDGKSAMQLKCGSLLPGHRYYVNVTFRNTSNGAYLYLGYQIN